MRALRETALIAAPGNALSAVNPNQPSATFDILAFARTVLGRGDDLTAVVAWARIVAAGPGSDASIAAWCREMGWQERTFHRRRRRACERIAAAKCAADLRDHRSARREGRAPPAQQRSEAA